MTELKFTFIEERPSRGELLKKVLLRTAIGVAFIFIGKSKFELHSQWIEIFERIGIGQWFRYLTGVLQVGGAILVLISRTFPIGILMLASTMLGAMLAWIFFLGVPLAAIIPGTILGFLLFVGAEELIDLAEKSRRLFFGNR